MPDIPTSVVQWLPKAIRAKVTQLIGASRAAAFSGAADPDDMDEIEEYEAICREQLERTIMKHLARKTSKRS